MDLNFVSTNCIWLIVVTLLVVGFLTKFTFTEACIGLIFIAVLIFLGISLYETLSGVVETLSSNPALSISRAN